MGKWMEVLNQKPPYEYPGWEEYEKLIVKELAPHPIIYCYVFLAKNLRNQFPYLKRLSINSGYYIEEEQLLNPKEVELLLKEFIFLRKLTHREVFIQGFDAKIFYE